MNVFEIESSKSLKNKVHVKNKRLYYSCITKEDKNMESFIQKCQRSVKKCLHN